MQSASSLPVAVLILISDNGAIVAKDWGSVVASVREGLLSFLCVLLDNGRKVSLRSETSSCKKGCDNEFHFQVYEIALEEDYGNYI